MSSEANLLRGGLEAELFRGHSATILLLGFIHNCQDMVTVDNTGRVIVWKYTRFELLLLLLLLLLLMMMMMMMMMIKSNSNDMRKLLVPRTHN